MKNFLHYTRNSLLFLGWLLLMLAPCAIIGFAMKGELNWTRSTYESDRVWLIQETDQRGLGYAAMRVATDNRPQGTVCVRNSVRFFLWKGEATGQNNDWCECFTPEGKTTNAACP